MAGDVGMLAVLMIAACSSQDPLDVLGREAGDAEVSEFQAEILEDGAVTPGEMERAVASYADCLLDLGITTRASYRESDRAYSYEFSTEAADASVLLDGPDGRACKAEYLDDVELAFADRVGPSAEEDAQYYESVARCMREAGFDVTDAKPATLSMWFQTQPVEYQACLDQAAGSG